MYLKNSVWMIVDKIFTMLSTLIIGIYVARYIGVEKFGLISYSISILGIIYTIADFGTTSLIFKSVSKRKIKSNRLLFSTLAIRIIIYLLAATTLLFILKGNYSSGDFYLVAGMFVAYLFFAIDVFNVYLGASLQSKKNTIVNIFATSFASIVRVVMVIFTVPYNLFFIPYLVLFAYSFFARMFYVIKDVSISLHQQKKFYKIFALSALPLMLSELAISVYTRISMIYLEHYTDLSTVGAYSATSNLANAWTFVPLAIITSFFTRIFSMNSDNDRRDSVVSLYIGSFIMALPVLIVGITIPYYVLHFTFGDAYYIGRYESFLLIASYVLSIFGTISYKTIISYGGYTYVAKKMFVSCIFSVLISYVLTKHYGVMGACVATFLTELLSVTLFDYFYRKGLLLRMQINIFTQGISAMSNFIKMIR